MDELFSLSREPETKRQANARKHEAKNVGEMRRLFGHGPEGASCGACQHLQTIALGARYFKCALARQSRSTATDWRKGWAACGKFETRIEVPR